jgi:hypothetical protein
MRFPMFVSGITEYITLILDERAEWEYICNEN